MNRHQRASFGAGLLCAGFALFDTTVAAAQTPSASYAPIAVCQDDGVGGTNSGITRAALTGAYVNEQSSQRTALCPILTGVATLPVHKINVVELEVVDSHAQDDLDARICYRGPGGPRVCGPWASSTGASSNPQVVSVHPPAKVTTNRTAAYLEVRFPPRIGSWAAAFYRYTVYGF